MLGHGCEKGDDGLALGEEDLWEAEGGRGGGGRGHGVGGGSGLFLIPRLVDNLH